MTEPPILFLIEDDWELRGNGTGNVADLQYLPARFLLDLADDLGLKITFMVEVCQQLAFRKAMEQNRDIAIQVELWERSVRLMRERGHDVQLHLHPQWMDAELEHGSFRVSSRWSLPSLPEETQRALVSRSLEYLGEVLAPVDPEHAFVAYKAGAWSMQPSGPILRILREHGIQIVIAGGRGVVYRTPFLTVDYSTLEEDTLPYRPDPEDICRLGPGNIPMVVLPLPFYRLGLPAVAAKVWNVASRKLRGSALYPYPGSDRGGTPLEGGMGDRFRNKIRGLQSLDISALPASEMTGAIDQIVERALRLEQPSVPVVLQTHSKTYRGNWGAIRAVFEHLVKHHGAHSRLVTCRELAPLLGTGIPVRAREVQ